MKNDHKNSYFMENDLFLVAKIKHVFQDPIFFLANLWCLPPPSH